MLINYKHYFGMTAKSVINEQRKYLVWLNDRKHTAKTITNVSVLTFSDGKSHYKLTTKLSDYLTVTSASDVLPIISMDPSRTVPIVNMRCDAARG